MENMSKIVGAAGAVAGTIYLSKRENRKIVKDQLNKAKKKLSTRYIKNLGKPADIDHSDMISEGAMSSVQYYNNLQQESLKNKH